MRYFITLLFLAMVSIAWAGDAAPKAPATEAAKAAAAAPAPASASSTVSVPNASPAPAAAAVEPSATSAITPTAADTKSDAKASPTSANAAVSDSTTTANNDSKTADTAKEVGSSDLLGILKTTEAIISLLIALIIAVITAVLKYKSTKDARAALQTLVEKVEVAKADNSTQRAAKSICVAVATAMPSDESAAGALIHSFAKAAEKKLGIKGA